MKKLSYILIVLCFVSLLVLGLSSCGSAIKAPSGLRVDVAEQTVRWNAVKGAKFYTVQISGQEKTLTTKANYISLEFLPAGQYEVRVQANGGEAVGNSGFAKLKDGFTRPEETGLKYQLINNGTEYELIDGGTASGDVVMESVFRGKPVTAIADGALDYNMKITSFTVGANVKTIGAKAFVKCPKLTSITIPEGVTSIGEAAFQSCKALTEITLPSTVTAVAPYTFAWCSGLEKVTLGKDLQVIGDYAFSSCEGLTTMTYTGREAEANKAFLPNDLVYIAPYAFADCYAVTDVHIGENTQYIAAYAFQNSTALTNLNLGSGLLTIDEAAFYKCTSLTAVVIPNSTQALGNYVFYGCTALADVKLGSGLTSIGNQVFIGTALLASAENQLIVDGWLLHMMNYNAEIYTLPKGEIYGIASYAFSRCTKLTQVNLKGVKYIGMAAFVGCESLYKVSFDDALLDIGAYAFYGCTYLKDAAVGNNLQRIGDYAFSGCKTMTALAIPDTVTYIGQRAFRGAGAYDAVPAGSVVYVGNWAVDFVPTTAALTVRLQDGTRGIAAYTFANQGFSLVSMPDSLEFVCRGAFYKSVVSLVSLSPSIKVIDDYAFYECSITNFGGENFDLVIPEGTVYIGRSAFYKCSYIVCLTVPGSVETIGAYAFYGCNNLGATVNVQLGDGKDENGEEIEPEVITVVGKMELGDGIVSIGERAFQNCVSLVEVDIPDSVTSLGIRVFYKCASLTTVTLGKGVKNIPDYAFYKCVSLETVNTPSTLETVGNYAFRGCGALKTFGMQNVRSIGRYAFYACAALEEIVLPSSLTAIGDYAFRGCTGASAVILPASVETIGKHAFYGLKTTSFYSNSDIIKPYWDSRFNSSYRPFFWGCTLSEDGTYVVSFTAGTKDERDLLENADAQNGISDPYRRGFTFRGWATDATSKTVVYTSENVDEAPAGTVLYAVWDEPKPELGEVQE